MDKLQQANKHDKQLKSLFGENGWIIWKRFSDIAIKERARNYDEVFDKRGFDFQFCDLQFLESMLDQPQFVGWLKTGYTELEDGLDKTKYFKKGHKTCKGEGAKELKTYIRNLFPSLQTDIGLQVQGGTIEFNPNKVFGAVVAWDEVISYWNKVLDKLRATEQVSFVLSTIEIHEGKKTKPKVKKIKQYTKEQFDKMRPARIKEKCESSGFQLPEVENRETLTRCYLEQQGKSVSKDEIGLGDLLNAVVKASGKTITIKAPVEEDSDSDSGDDKDDDEDEEKIPKTLLDFPHIHYCIGIVNYEGGTNIMTKQKLGQIIYSVDMDKDVLMGKVAKETAKGGNTRLNMEDPVALIPYVMKNAQHLPPMREIYRIKNKESYHPVCFYNFKHEPKIDDMFFGMKEKIGSLPFEIMDDDYKVRTEKYTNSLEARTIKTCKKEWNLDQTINFVKSRMEAQSLYTCDGYIYEKITSHTYKCLVSVSKFYDQIDFGDHVVAKLKHNKKSEMYDLLRMKGKFPTIEISDEFYEFDDGIYHITTDTFYTEKGENMLCHMYFEGHNFQNLILTDDKQLQGMCDVIITPLEINNLINSETRKILLDYQKPKYNKKQNLVIQGESNCGKSSFIKTLCLLSSRGRICEPQTNSRFGLGDMKGRTKINSDEGQGMYEIKIPELLQITQGACELTCPVRYKIPEEVEFKTNWLVACMSDILGFDREKYENSKLCTSDEILSSNPNDWTYIISKNARPKYITEDPEALKALGNRFNRIIFKKPIATKDQMDKHEVDAKIDEQLVYFFVWLAKSYPIKIQEKCIIDKTKNKCRPSQRTF
jgi:hypothetical protein